MLLYVPSHIWPRCGQDVAKMWPRCGRDLVEIGSFWYNYTSTKQIVVCAYLKTGRVHALKTKRPLINGNIHKTQSRFKNTWFAARVVLISPTGLNVESFSPFFLPEIITHDASKLKFHPNVFRDDIMLSSLFEGPEITRGLPYGSPRFRARTQMVDRWWIHQSSLSKESRQYHQVPMW